MSIDLQLRRLVAAALGETRAAQADKRDRPGAAVTLAKVHSKTMQSATTSEETT